MQRLDPRQKAHAWDIALAHSILLEVALIHILAQLLRPLHQAEHSELLVSLVDAAVRHAPSRCAVAWVANDLAGGAD